MPEIVSGVMDYGKEQDPAWVVIHLTAPYCYAGSTLRDLQLDGLVAQIDARRDLQAVRAEGLPVVAVNHRVVDPDLPAVCVDTPYKGIMVARHFFERNFRNFAYCGFRDEESRAEGEHDRDDFGRRSYVETVKSRGHDVSEFLLPHSTPANRFRAYEPEEEARLSTWLRGLSKPVGIFACHDLIAVQLMDLLTRIGLRCPADVAIVGVGDGKPYQPGLSTRLTTVVEPIHKIGFLAAEKLDGWMRGTKPNPMVTRLKPLRIAARASSDIHAVEDPRLQKAIEFIEDNPSTPIRVEDVCAYAGMSRRSLERNLKQAIGQTPSELINRLRFEHVCELLATTDMKLKDVAVQAGLTDGRHLSLFFKSMSGQTPSEFRANAR